MDTFTIPLSGPTASTLVTLTTFNVENDLGEAAIVFWNERTDGWDIRMTSQYLPKRAEVAALVLGTGHVIEFGRVCQDVAIDEDVLIEATLLVRRHSGAADDPEPAAALDQALAEVRARRAEHRKWLEGDGL